MHTIKLENDKKIVGRSWMKKYGIIINITNNSLAFWHGHYTYIRAISSTTLNKPKLSSETVVIRIEKDITFQKMINMGLKADMTDFLQMPNKLPSKKIK